MFTIVPNNAVINTENKKLAIGTSRRCEMIGGQFVCETITDWKVGSHYTVETYETSMPVKDASATIGVRSLGKNKTEAYMQMKMKPTYKIFQPFLYIAFKFIVAPSILQGLEELHRQEHKFKVVS